ncbi:lipocalin family protein [Microbacterium sp. ZW T5_56]|uniref:lipocalin family protein n=1 Tax=Microbacterium sp. ZW T5_56 TaxID=3378081 RepID=UPI003855025C
MAEKTDVTSVDAVDLVRYAGLWYEIGRLPLLQEPTDGADITAEYTLLDDGTVRVDNRSFDGDAQPRRAVGIARPADGAFSRLKVSFLPQALRWLPFTEGDYWVLKIDADYTVALVGTPDRKHLWLLSRTPRLSGEVESEFLMEAQRQGFDLAAWIHPVQTGGRVTDDMVE